MEIVVERAAALEEAAAGLAASLGERDLLLAAHRIAVADHFGDLLCLARMNGVERMPHQIETVKRALRALRGRALLADE